MILHNCPILIYNISSTNEWFLPPPPSFGQFSKLTRLKERLTIKYGGAVNSLMPLNIHRRRGSTVQSPSTYIEGGGQQSRAPQHIPREGVNSLEPLNIYRGRGSTVQSPSTSTEGGGQGSIVKCPLTYTEGGSQQTSAPQHIHYRRGGVGGVPVLCLSLLSVFCYTRG